MRNANFAQLFSVAGDRKLKTYAQDQSLRNPGPRTQIAHGKILRALQGNFARPRTRFDSLDGWPFGCEVPRRLRGSE
jgi:hypothetical protein